MDPGPSSATGSRQTPKQSLDSALSKAVGPAPS